MDQGKTFQRILPIACLGHAINDMYWFILPILLPLIKSDFGLNYIEAGFLFTSYSAISAVGSLLSGALGDRLGRRLIISGGFLITSLAFILCALCETYWQLFLALSLVGAGMSTFHPSMMAHLMNVFSKKRGAVMGIFQFFGWTGTVIMLLVLSFLIGRVLSWREVFGVAALPGIIFAPFFFVVAGPLTVERISQLSAEKGITERSNRKNRIALILFLAANATLAITFFGVISFIPTYMVEAKGFSLVQADYFLTATVLGSLVGSFLSGKMADRLMPLAVIQIMVFAVIPVILFLTVATGPAELVALLVLFGLCNSGVYPPQAAYLAELTPVNVRGRTYGLILSLLGLVGATAPGLVGLIADKVGLSLAFCLGVFPLLLAGFLLFILNNPRFRASCLF